ncbi:hypothetical protein TSO352_03765 [Azospirillum sp. TSO35-2]|nr:hypothetical protein TSO352_03765 [Azospirillum sp. TSO35-2]
MDALDRQRLLRQPHPLILAGRAVADPEGQPQRQHIQPAEGHHRPGPVGDEDAGNHQIHQDNDAHQHPEPAAPQAAVGVEDGVEEDAHGAGAAGGRGAVGIAAAAAAGDGGGVVGGIDGHTDHSNRPKPA